MEPISKISIRVCIIGSGKVGQSLNQLFNQLVTEHTIDVKLISRDLKQQKEACQISDVVLLTVDDNSIQNICEQLSAHFKVGSVIAHCSGALSSNVLMSAKHNECSVASIHPLNTFPNTKAALRLFSSVEHGTSLYAEGESTALDTLLPLFKQIGFKPLTLRTQSKPAYHAACVFACNYLTVLMELSLNTAGQAGLDKAEFWQAIQPLVNATLKNINEHDPADSLSGPIVRGDLVTVESHVNVLTETQLSYKHLGLQALKLAVSRGELSAEKIRTLETILS